MSLEVRKETDRGPLASYAFGSGVSSDLDEQQIVLLHGFSQGGLCMETLAERLSVALSVGPSERSVHRSPALRSVDLPGHGHSSANTTADLWTTADLVGETCGRATYLGYSMGGRVALHLALGNPGCVESLVLLGTTAGIEDEAGRSLRRDSDHELAARIESVGVEQFLEEWLTQPLFANLPKWARFERERALNSAEGLADSLRYCGTGSMEPLWSRLSTIECPVLVLAGGLDSRYCELGRRIADEIGPNAVFEALPDAGHAVHLEQPDLTAQAIVGFLGSRSN